MKKTLLAIITYLPLLVSCVSDGRAFSDSQSQDPSSYNELTSKADLVSSENNAQSESLNENLNSSNEEEPQNYPFTIISGLEAGYKYDLSEKQTITVSYARTCEGDYDLRLFPGISGYSNGVSLYTDHFSEADLSYCFPDPNVQDIPSRHKTFSVDFDWDVLETIDSTYFRLIVSYEKGTYVGEYKLFHFSYCSDSEIELLRY